VCRPHDEIFNFTKKGKSKVALNRVTETERREALFADAYVMSSLPAGADFRARSGTSSRSRRRQVGDRALLHQAVPCDVASEPSSRPLISRASCRATQPRAAAARLQHARHNPGAARLEHLRPRARPVPRTRADHPSAEASPVATLVSSAPRARRLSREASEPDTRAGCAPAPSSKTRSPGPTPPYVCARFQRPCGHCLFGPCRKVPRTTSTVVWQEGRPMSSVREVDGSPRYPWPLAGTSEGHSALMVAMRCPARPHRGRAARP
jgi:hypothetical protein